MNILTLDGLEPRLFSLIGPLAMNPKVLKANNNYPFKTTEKFQWYIAMEGDDVLGFLPVEKKASGLVINNYYIQNDDPDVLERLLEAVETEEPLLAIVQTRHEEAFTRCRFQVVHRWTKYLKMTNKTQTNEQ